MSMIVSPRQLSQLSELYHQLGQLTASGIGLIQALEMQHRNPPSRTMRPPLARVLSQLQAGAPFGDALDAVPHWMASFDRALLRAAEASGRLPSVFQMLAEHYRSRSRLVTTFLGLCAYPCLLLHVAVLIFPLELLQGLVLRGEVFAFLAQKVMILAPLYLLVFAVLYLGQAQRASGIREGVERLVSALPLFGKARRQLALARLAAAMEALVAAGVPLFQAWPMAGAACGSVILNRAIRGMLPRWEAGESPAEGLTRCREFPEMFSNQYASGEVSGRLEETLKWLQEYYQEEGSRSMRTAIFALGGLVMGGVMLMVAWRIISFYIGYFQRINEAIP